MEPAARKRKILAAIVERFIESGEPVGSKSLLADAGLKVSSATVRNDMAELTDKGYLAQPHTSAGANTPPEPPEPTVNDVATTFRKKNATQQSGAMRHQP